MKKYLGGEKIQKYSNDSKMKAAVLDYLTNNGGPFYEDGNLKFTNKCLDVHGDYIEK